jgi:hypothetical protein
MNNASLSKKRQKAKIRKISIISLIIVVLLILVRINYVNSRCKDINYAVAYYMTSGIFNNNKVLAVNGMKLTFSDDNKTIAEVSGLYYEAPHFRKKYQISLSKNKGKMWTLDYIKDITDDINKNN